MVRPLSHARFWLRVQDGAPVQWKWQSTADRYAIKFDYSEGELVVTDLNG